MKFIVEIEPEFDETQEDMVEVLYEALRDCAGIYAVVNPIPELELG